MEGIIIKNQSNDYTVRTSNGLYVCKPRGKFRNDKITPLVGDKVIIDDINNYLLEIKPRKNSLIRPQIANVDIALIVLAGVYLLITSKDVKEVKVPNVVGLTTEKAIKMIKEKGLEYTTKSEESATVEEGKVIRTEPTDSLMPKDDKKDKKTE